MKPYFRLSKDVLEKLYWEDKLSTYQISKKVGLHQSTIYEKIKKFGIKTRTLHESHLGKRSSRYIDIPYKILYQLFVKEKKSTLEIGKLFNVSNSTISSKLKRFKIPTRTTGESLKIRFMDKTKHPNNYIKISKEFLIENYVKRKRLTEDIAKGLNIHTDTILKRLKEFEIPITKPKKVSDDIVISLWKMGMSDYQIAKRVGITPSSISLRRRQLNLHAHNPNNESGRRFTNDELIKLLDEGLTQELIANRLGVSRTTIEGRMKRLNLKSNFKSFNGSNKFYALDNHILKSGRELEIDNWLYLNKIVHFYEIKIPNTRLKTDFFIPTPNGGIYIEYWGMPRKKSYIKKMEFKKHLYKKLGLNLLEILPSDPLDRSSPHSSARTEIRTE